jgi:hypothetical protein
MANTNAVGAIASVVAGGALAAASVVGLISSQTGAPDRSPTDVSKPAVIDYGTTAG